MCSTPFTTKLLFIWAAVDLRLRYNNHLVHSLTDISFSFLGNFSLFPMSPLLGTNKALSQPTPGIQQGPYRSNKGILKKTMSRKRRRKKRKKEKKKKKETSLNKQTVQKKKKKKKKEKRKKGIPCLSSDARNNSQSF